MADPFFESLSNLPEGKQTIMTKLLETFGLSQYYPGKISLGKVMQLGKRSVERNKTKEKDATDIPWLILQKLIMLDYRSRDSEISEFNASQSDKVDEEEFVDVGADDLFSDIFDSDTKRENPLDIFFMVFSCCDLMLRQTLVQKMFQCRLAVPFIMPHTSDEMLTLCLWALRGIAVEWRDENNEALETSIVSQPINIVSFIRLGRPFCSKSKLINNIMSDQIHNTFFNKDCPDGNTDRSIADGLVETSFYIPSGKDDSHFKDVTMFLNLRGDAIEYEKQVQVISKLSNVVVACIDDTDLGNHDVAKIIKMIHKGNAKVVVVISDKHVASLDSKKIKSLWAKYVSGVGKDDVDNEQKIFAFKGNREKNENELKCELRENINKALDGATKKQVIDAADPVNFADLHVDENDRVCENGRINAVKVISLMSGKSPNQIKREMLPLQGDDWLEWTKLLKSMKKTEGTAESTSIQEKGKIQTAMNELRQKQQSKANNLGPLIKEFISRLIELTDTPSMPYFLQSLKFHFDEISRKTLPALQKKYHNAWTTYKKANDLSKNSPEEDRSGGKQKSLKALKLSVDTAEKELAMASVGLEHLFRELGQHYEAIIECDTTSTVETKQILEKLPGVVANLLLNGHPIELMDGDASCVPLTWVKAVFASLQELVGDKKIFTMSVLGIQSSGKSTLLNTMFGLQFAVSAGRCTRGVYMQLVRVQPGCCLPFDFVVVIDTEGLRAPELGHTKHSHDNELATFVVGLGDVTIMNIKGENVSEIKDVLQIVVHAFLRMKIANKNIQRDRKCIFIHQNVAAINAKEKMRYGCQKLRENLDEMTEEAASSENLSHVHTFDQVIEFNSDNDVWYFSDLWHGDPPMAPANPGYHTKVKEVKSHILDITTKEGKSFFHFSDLSILIQDMWNGVLSDDFVFSFRNTLAAKAYNKMEKKLSKLKWNVESHVLQWFNDNVRLTLAQCSSEDDLVTKTTELVQSLHLVVLKKLGEVEADLEDFFNMDDLKDILIQWKTEKFYSLQNSAWELERGFEKEIYEVKEGKKVDLLQNQKASLHEKEMLVKAAEVADSLKGQSVDERSLKTRFEAMWSQWIEELASKNPPPKAAIAVRVEYTLWDEFKEYRNLLEAELEETPLGTPMQNPFHISVIKDHVSFEENIFKKLWGKVTKSADGWKKALEHINNLIEIILQRVKTELNTLENSGEKFQNQMSRKIIKIVIEKIDDHNSRIKEMGFKVLKPLEIKLAVRVCHYAMAIFKRMQSEYDKAHSVVSKLESYKKTTWNLFKNKVRQCTEEVIFADMLCDKLEMSVAGIVEDQIPAKIIDGIYNHFGVKHELIKAILKELCQNEDFEGFRSYISDAKTFALDWMGEFADTFTFAPQEDNHTRYSHHARDVLQSKIDKIKMNITSTTETVMAASDQTTADWLGMFTEQDPLLLSAADKEDLLVYSVSNFKHLKDLLHERLSQMEAKLLETFQAETSESIRWPGKAPYVMVTDRLWGCGEQCPFCKEPCQRSDNNHQSQNDLHQCIQHRPQGVSGRYWNSSEKLVVESCSYEVQSKSTFSCMCQGTCKAPGESYHPYRLYNTHYPNWSIHPSPDMDSSHFWMWFMVKFKSKLMKHHNKNAPDIPSSWSKITKERAIKSLYESQ